MRINFDDLVEEDRFKTTNELKSILGITLQNEKVYIDNVPYFKDRLVECSILLINNLARSKQEYLSENENNVVFGIYVLVRDTDTGRLGLHYITANEETLVLSCKYNEIYNLGYKIFVGNTEEGETVQILDNVYEFLNITEYNVYEVLRLANFNIAALALEDVEKTQCLFIEVFSEELEEEGEPSCERIDTFTLRDRKEVDKFFEDLLSEFYNELTKEEIESVERNSVELQEIMIE